MLSPRAKQLLNEVLELPEPERVEIAEELAQAAHLGPEWISELDDRVAEIDAGSAELVTADVAHAQFRADVEALRQR